MSESGGTADGAGDPVGRIEPGGRRAAAVVDVDGVVADVRHRLHHLSGRRRDWAGFFAAAAADPPLAQGVDLALALAAEHDVVWLTGRPERLRTVTARWLSGHRLPAGLLIMRPDADHRPARTFKRDELRRLRQTKHIALVVDDDPDVVAMVEREGLPVRLADWVARTTTLHSAQERDGRT